MGTSLMVLEVTRCIISVPPRPSQMGLPVLACHMGQGLAGQGVAAGGVHADMRDVIVVEVGHFQQLPVGGGQTGDHRDLVLDDGGHHVVRGELGQQRNGGGAGKGDVAEGAVARRKGHRGGAAQDVAGAHLVDVLVDQVGLDQHLFDEVDAALGLAGGAGGEEDDADVVGVQLDVGELVGGRGHLFAEGDVALGFDVFGFAAYYDELGGELEFGLGAFHRGHQGEAHHKGLEFGVVHYKGHFFLGPQRGDGHRDGADLLDAEVGGNGFRHIGHAQAHPVLGLDPDLFEDVGELVGHAQQFFIGDLLVAEQDGDVVTFHMLVQKFFGDIPLS